MQAIEDIEPFQDVLHLKPRETALSYVSRLAAFHGCLSANDFCLAFGLTMMAITRGEAATLLRLAALSGESYDDLCRWSPRAVSQNRFSINGELFEIRNSPRAMLTICPECARSDIASHPDISPDLAFYGRAEWAVPAIRMCPIHSVLLARIEMKPVKLARTDFLNFTGAVLAGFDSLETASAQWSEVEAYAMDRLCGSPVSLVPILDEMALCDALAVCQAFGADYLKVTENLRFLDPQLAHQCRQIGFAAFHKGKNSLLAHLAEMRRKFWRGGTSSHRVLGKTLDHLTKADHSDAFRLLKRTVAEAAFATFPYRAGDTLLGIVCERRSLHTYRSARIAYDVPPAVLRAFGANNDTMVVHRGANDRDVLFDVDTADVLFRTRMPLIAASTLRRRLGLSPQFFSEAIAGGLIEPIKDDAVQGTSAIFSLPQVEGYLAHVTRTWRRLETSNAKMLSLADTYNQSFVFSRRVFTLLNEGRLTDVGYVDARSKLAGLRLDPEEVLSVDSGVKEPMTITDVAYYVRTQQRVVKALTERHFLPAIQHNHGRGTRRVYDRPDVEGFVATYATSAEMAKAIKMPIKTRLHLERMKIFPAILLGDLGQFYYRSDLDAILRK